LRSQKGPRAKSFGKREPRLLTQLISFSFVGKWLVLVVENGVQICSVFNDAISNSDNIMSNYVRVNDKLAAQFITLSVLRQVYSLFLSEFSKEGHLVFLFQFTVSCHFLKVIRYLLTPTSSYFLPYTPTFLGPSITWFLKAVPTQDMTNPVSLPFSLYVEFSFPPGLYIILLNFSHDRSNWSPSSSSATV
jgi:hypothetical protein